MPRPRGVKEQTLYLSRLTPFSLAGAFGSGVLTTFPAPAAQQCTKGQWKKGSGVPTPFLLKRLPTPYLRSLLAAAFASGVLVASSASAAQKPSVPNESPPLSLDGT